MQFTNKNKDTFEFNSPTQLPPFLSNDSENESEDHTERTPSFASSASKKRINQFISKVLMRIWLYLANLFKGDEQFEKFWVGDKNRYKIQYYLVYIHILKIMRVILLINFIIINVEMIKLKR